jgi:hypothetical protein
MIGHNESFAAYLQQSVVSLEKNKNLSNEQKKLKRELYDEFMRKEGIMKTLINI